MNTTHTPATHRYPRAMRILHWAVALLILGLLPFGLWMADLPQTDPDRLYYYSLHKSFGVLVLILASLRLLNRWRSTLPAPIAGVKPIEHTLATLGHWALYALMLAMPISGIAMSQSYGYPVQLFGWTIPTFFTEDKPFAELAKAAHSLLAWALIGLVSIHVLAALKHRFIDRVEDMFRRMW